MLLKVGDLLVEGVDVGGRAEPGLAPGLLAERFGQTVFQLADACAEPGGAFVGGEQVGLQRGPGDGRPGCVARGWRGGFQGVDLAEQVAVPVEEAAVDGCGAGDRGDADLGAVGGGLPASARYRNWHVSAGWRVGRPVLRHAQFPPCPRIGAVCCERAAGSRSAQRPRSGAAGVLDAAVRERIIGQPGLGGGRGAAVRCSGAGAFLMAGRWPATGRPGIRQGGSQAYLGPRAGAFMLAARRHDD